VAGASTSTAVDFSATPNLTAAATSTATGGGFGICASSASTGVAILVLAVSDLCFRAKGGLFKLNGDVFAEISASLSAMRVVPRRPATFALTSAVREA